MTRLTIAIPSKGRLKEKSEAFFKECGFKLRQIGGDRGYSAEIKGLDAEVMLLSAREIAEGLISGEIHIGITGEDLLSDISPAVDDDTHTFKRLGFGHADVVVAVPQSWLDVSTMADLEAAGALFRARHGRRMRVATKYLAITRRYFADNAVGEYRLVESAGATEAAPAAGTAELIVDITSTGATLKANGLKVLVDGVMLNSQAVLAGSLHADWQEAHKATLSQLLDSIAAKSNAEGQMILTASGEIDVAALGLQGKLTTLTSNSALCAEREGAACARALMAANLGPVT
ncbi:MAG: ATP phosphoribosyltransferase, partial [Pseudomonadota bacterium]